MSKLTQVNSVLKSRFKDGGMPTPSYGMWRTINKSQLTRCIINTWAMLNGDKAILSCIDEVCESESDSLIHMGMLIDMTMEYPLEDIYVIENFENKFKMPYKEFYDKYIVEFLKWYIDEMSLCKSRFFFNALKIRYNKLTKQENKYQKEKLTIFSNKKVKCIYF